MGLGMVLHKGTLLMMMMMTITYLECLLQYLGAQLQNSAENKFFRPVSSWLNTNDDEDGGEDDDNGNDEDKDDDDDKQNKVLQGCEKK